MKDNISEGDKVVACFCDTGGVADICEVVEQIEWYSRYSRDRLRVQTLTNIRGGFDEARWPVDDLYRIPQRLAEEVDDANTSKDKLYLVESWLERNCDWNGEKQELETNPYEEHAPGMVSRD